MVSILALSFVAEERAQELHSRALQVHFSTLIIGLASLYASETITYLLAITALCAEGTAWWLRQKAAKAHELGRRGRRQAILADSFASEMEPYETVALRGAFDDSWTDLAKAHPVKNFYSSSCPPGPQRLRENIQESAFWSHRLYAAAQKRLLAKAVVCIVIITIVVMSALPLATSATSLLVARIALLIATLLVAIDVVGRIIAWGAAAAAADAIDRRLEHRETFGEQSALSAFADYATVTALAPPIPTVLYQQLKARLNEEWSLRQGASAR